MLLGKCTLTDHSCSASADNDNLLLPAILEQFFRRHDKATGRRISGRIGGEGCRSSWTQGGEQLLNGGSDGGSDGGDVKNDGQVNDGVMRNELIAMIVP